MCGREFPNETIRVSSRGWCLNGCSSNHEHPFAFSLPAVLELQLPHVLIVDDEPGIRFALRRWFARQHWTVSEAGDGQAAIALLVASDDASDSRVDLVICDLHLPMASGQDVLRILMSSRPPAIRTCSKSRSTCPR
jgi:PleD family two-component response regulator